MTPNRLVKVYILDDNESAIELLRRLLSDYSVEIIGTSTYVEKGREDIIALNPDLLFLDVEMPGMSGLDFYTDIQQYTKPEMKVVFYTGYDKYLLEALRRQAFDYMLKPATKDELAKIMTRYYEERISSFQPTTPRTSQPIVIVNAINEHTMLHIGDIAFFRFQSDRKLWEVVRTDGTACLLRHKTTADTILNYSPNFVQIHKHYIVNMQMIAKIQGSVCILRPPMDHIDELRVSKNFRHELMSIFYSM